MESYLVPGARSPLRDRARYVDGRNSHIGRKDQVELDRHQSRVRTAIHAEDSTGVRAQRCETALPVQRHLCPGASPWAHR